MIMRVYKCLVEIKCSDVCNIFLNIVGIVNMLKNTHSINIPKVPPSPTQEAKISSNRSTVVLHDHAGME